MYEKEDKWVNFWRDRFNKNVDADMCVHNDIKWATCNLLGGTGLGRPPA